MKIRGQIIRATQAHIDAMKGKLRESDRRDLWNVMRVSPDEGLQKAFDVSELSWVGILEGKPILCFGVSRLSLLSSVGSPWMLATDNIKLANREFIRGCKLCVGTMLSFFDRLENMVDVRSQVSIRWLKWCGFKLGGKVPYGPNKLLFYEFYMDREG